MIMTTQVEPNPLITLIIGTRLQAYPMPLHLTINPKLLNY